MQIDEFLELVRRRRSIRRFKPDPIPDEFVEKILEAARWAMSGANGQPWEFIVVKNRETINKMAEHYLGIQKGIYQIEMTRVEELRQPKYASGGPVGPPSFKDAPVIILVLGDHRTLQATVLAARFHIPGEGGSADGTYLKNMANPVMLMHLAAAALGLGSEWFSMPGRLEPVVKALLDVPADLIIHTMVPIGYPAYEPPPPYRRELKEMVHYEKYDHSKYRTDEDIYNFILDLRRRTRATYDIAFRAREG